ncbi:MAG: hypothetical protein PHW01_02310 [Patescibacteria group bacterium]|nr:hypothetical protein [Patescibacteria group bacterium]
MRTVRVIVVIVIILLLAGGGVYLFWPKTSETNTLDQELADLKAANATLVTEKTETANKISELEKAKKSLTEANTTLTSQVANLAGDRDAIKQSELYFAKVYREGLAVNEKANKDNGVLRKEIERLKAENKQLVEDNKLLQTQYNELLTEKKAAEAARKVAEDKVAGLNRDIDAAKQGQDAAEMKAVKAEQNLTRLEAEKAKAQSEMVTLNAKIANDLVDKKALQDQLDTAKKALEAMEGRLGESDKLVAKSPTMDTVKENLALKAEIRFLYATILVATSSEKNLSDESRRKATNLMVRLTYQSDADLRFKAAAKVMEEMPLDGAESVDQLHTRWGAWRKTQE